jgi:hypothetical protein
MTHSIEYFWKIRLDWQHLAAILNCVQNEKGIFEKIRQSTYLLQNHVDSLRNGPSDPRTWLVHQQFEQIGNIRQYCNATVIRYVITPTTFENGSNKREFPSLGEDTRFQWPVEEHTKRQCRIRTPSGPGPLLLSNSYNVFSETVNGSGPDGTQESSRYVRSINFTNSSQIPCDFDASRSSSLMSDG